MTIRVSVVIALPGRQDVIDLDLPEGSTVEDALAAAEIARRFPELDTTRIQVGIWSQPCTRAARLREGDRVEIYRPLTADPKQMRRERARRR